MDKNYFVNQQKERDEYMYKLGIVHGQVSTMIMGVLGFVTTMAVKSLFLKK